MVRLVCQACHTESFVADDAQAALCDSCGSALSSIEEAGIADEDGLAADPREAFPLEADQKADTLFQSAWFAVRALLQAP